MMFWRQQQFQHINCLPGLKLQWWLNGVDLQTQTFELVLQCKTAQFKNDEILYI